MDDSEQIKRRFESALRQVEARLSGSDIIMSPQTDSKNTEDNLEALRQIEQALHQLDSLETMVRQDKSDA